MKLLVKTVSILSISSTSALSLPRRQVADSECCFALYAEGTGISQAVNEDTIGESRIGGEYPQGSYCVSASYTGVRDSLGNQCTISSSNQQFQCVEAGVTSYTNFTISNSNFLQHGGSSNWYACPASGPGDDGSLNIFAGGDTTGCIPIQLLTTAYSCTALGRPSSSTSSSALAASTEPSVSPNQTSAASEKTSNAVPLSGFSTSLVAASSTETPTTTEPLGISPGSNPTAGPTATNCPIDLNTGKYVTPSLIVPISQDSPDTSFGTQFSPIITSENTTLFGFDVPDTYTGICSLIFLFPYGNEAVFPYNFSGSEQEVYGDGGISFLRLNGDLDSTTTWNTRPAEAVDYGMTQIIPGNNYTIANFLCPGGHQLAIAAESMHDVALQYFQDDETVAIGLYVVPCS